MSLSSQVALLESDSTNLAAQAMLRLIENVLNGGEIDCSGTPFIPQGWTYDENEEDRVKSAFRGKLKAGQIFANLHLEEAQKTGVMSGDDLRLALEGKLVLTAHCLDFVLRPENQHLISDELKGKYIPFWGSIYRRSSGGACVRCLWWDDDRWRWSGSWIADGFGARRPGPLL